MWKKYGETDIICLNSNTNPPQGGKFMEGVLMNNVTRGTQGGGRDGKTAMTPS